MTLALSSECISADAYDWLKMVALGLCWKSGIAAEVIGTPSGSIGEHLQQAKIYLDMPDLFAWTLVIVLVSLAFEKTVLALLSWTAKRLERM